MTELTTNQQQRSEALASAAALLVERSVNPGTVFNRGDKAEMAGMLADDAGTAITLADYIVRGPDPETVVRIDEDGIRLQQEES